MTAVVRNDVIGDYASLSYSSVDMAIRYATIALRALAALAVFDDEARRAVSSFSAKVKKLPTKAWIAARLRAHPGIAHLATPNLMRIVRNVPVEYRRDVHDVLRAFRAVNRSVVEGRLKKAGALRQIIRLLNGVDRYADDRDLDAVPAKVSKRRPARSKPWKGMPAKTKRKNARASAKAAP